MLLYESVKIAPSPEVIRPPWSVGDCVNVYRRRRKSDRFVFCYDDGEVISVMHIPLSFKLKLWLIKVRYKPDHEKYPIERTFKWRERNGYYAPHIMSGYYWIGNKPDVTVGEEAPPA